MEARFDGIHGNVEVFFRDYELMAALQGYEGEAKKILVGAFCTSAARYFYDKIVDATNSYDELKKEFIREFGVVSDPLAIFFSRRQENGESPLEYFYALDALAAHAGSVITDELFVQQFLRTTDVVSRSRLAAQIYTDKSHLRDVLRQVNDITSEECAPNPTNTCACVDNVMESSAPHQCASRTPKRDPYEVFESDDVYCFRTREPAAVMPDRTSIGTTNETSPQYNNDTPVSSEEDCLQPALIQDIHDTSKRTPFLTIECRNHKIDTLVDTGAVVSIISQKVAENLSLDVDAVNAELRNEEPPSSGDSGDESGSEPESPSEKLLQQTLKQDWAVESTERGSNNRDSLGVGEPTASTSSTTQEADSSKSSQPSLQKSYELIPKIDLPGGAMLYHSGVLAGLDGMGTNIGLGNLAMGYPHSFILGLANQGQEGAPISSNQPQFITIPLSMAMAASNPSSSTTNGCPVSASSDDSSELQDLSTGRK